MNRGDYHQQRLIGLQKAGLEPHLPPVRLVPDLSLIEYNDGRNNDENYNRPCLTTAIHSEKDIPDTRIEKSSFYTEVPPEKKVNSYVAWRTRNTHLFNKSSSSSKHKNSDHFNSKTGLISNNRDLNENSMLLSKIAEISERLEKEDSSDEVYSKSHQQQPIPETIASVTNFDNLKSCENDDSYKRVQELYERIFPSEKFKSLQSNSNFKYKSLVNSPENRELLENRKYLDKKDHQEVDISLKERHFGPKKKVTYECDDVPKVTVASQNKGNVHTKGNFSNDGNLSRHNHDHYSDENHSRFDNSVLNCRNGTQDTSLLDYHCDDNIYFRESRNDLIPMKKVFSYKDDRLRNNFDRPMSVERKSLQRYGVPKSSRYNQCLCPDCPQNKCAGSMERHRSSRPKFDENGESVSSSEENSLNKHCCYENYKKKKKKITVDELYKIVKLQNEQINLLQKQIDRLLEQNNEIKKLTEAKQLTSQSSLTPDEPARNPIGQKCSCGSRNNDNISDKFTAQSFAFSVLQGNSKVEQQNTLSNNSVKKCTNVSIGVMTSFVEVTQKMLNMNSQQFSSGIDVNQNCNNDGFVHSTIRENDERKDLVQQRGKKIINSSPASRFGQGSTCPAVTEESFTLNEVDLPELPVLVNEHVPTPQTSVHVDIQDYGSTSSSSESSDTESDNCSVNNPEESPPDNGRVGWTLYDNVVGQVNKILQRSKPSSETTDAPSPVVDDVRKATIQQLRRLGVSFIDNDTSAAKKVTFDPVFNRPLDNGVVNGFKQSNVNGSDGNCKIEEVPLKYLNEEQILKAAINIMNKKKVSANVGATPPINVSPDCGNNDVSFATMKYLERYRLLPSGTNNQVQDAVGSNEAVRPKKVKKQKSRNRICQQLPKQHHYIDQRLQQFQYNEQRPQNLLSNKILDITALKQQPKLL